MYNKILYGGQYENETTLVQKMKAFSIKETLCIGLIYIFQIAGFQTLSLYRS